MVNVEQLIRAVEFEPGVTPAALAARFAVSERTVRTYVRRANEHLAPVAHLEKQRGGGYLLVVRDADAYARRRSAKGLPATKHQRVAWLLNDLIQRTDWVTLDELAEVLYVSRSVLSADMKQVEVALRQFDLGLERRPRYGMRVTGSELNRRLCLAASVMDDVRSGDAEDPARTAWLERLGVRRDVLERVAAIVDDALRASSFHINAFTHQNLLVHIAIALLRIEEGAYVPMEPSDAAEPARALELAVARDISHGISRELGIELPEEEIVYIAIHLAAKQTYYDAADRSTKELGTDGSVEDNFVISDEVWDTVARILERIWSVFHFDFRDDLELRMNLARHIVPLAVRLRYHLNLKNPLLRDITERYPLAWSMAVEVADVLDGAYGSRPSHDELGYLALAFALALERKRGKAPRKNLLVVCASGAGSARLLEHRCRREFAGYVDRIYSCDVMHVQDMDFSKIDYVFTTVPIPVKLPVPVREVTYFFDAAEGERMREFLRDAAHASLVERAFRPDLFFSHLACATKDEILALLCERARAIHGGCEDLERLVWEREQFAATSFGNSVAMPHPLEAVSDDTFVTVGILERPIVWNEEGAKVQAVFLISFSKAGGSELDAFFGALADLFLDEAAIARLLADQRWETLCTLLREFGH